MNTNLIPNGDFIQLYWKNEKENVDMLDCLFVGCEDGEG